MLSTISGHFCSLTWRICRFSWWKNHVCGRGFAYRMLFERWVHYHAHPRWSVLRMQFQLKVQQVQWFCQSDIFQESCFDQSEFSFQQCNHISGNSDRLFGEEWCLCGSGLLFCLELSGVAWSVAAITASFAYAILNFKECHSVWQSFLEGRAWRWICIVHGFVQIWIYPPHGMNQFWGSVGVNLS